jgi:hypothetical protein
MKNLQKKPKQDIFLEKYMTTPHYGLPFADVIYKAVFSFEDLARKFIGVFVLERTDEETTKSLMERAKNKRETLDLICFHKLLIKVRKKIESAIIDNREFVFVKIPPHEVVSPAVKKAIVQYMLQNTPAKTVSFDSSYTALYGNNLQIELDLQKEKKELL